MALKAFATPRERVYHQAMDLQKAPGAPPAAAGWYPDPAGSGSHRYWDGSRWTDAVSSAIPPQTPQIGQDDSRGWAMGAHLSALFGLVTGLPFIGPLVVYLAKKDDPYVRSQAAEALNFNLSITLYGFVLGVVTFILLFVFIGILLIPLLFVLAVVWIVFVCVGAAAGSRGEDYRYPLTIRFLR